MDISLIITKTTIKYFLTSWTNISLTLLAIHTQYIRYRDRRHRIAEYVEVGLRRGAFASRVGVASEGRVVWLPRCESLAL